MTSRVRRSDARFATNAALAETEATTVNLSKEVQSNANQLHNAAFDAATSAQIKEPLSGSAVNQLEEGLAHKTDAAASQGAVDVEAAKATATGYVEQAKNLASGAFATAQSYVPSTTTTSNAASGVSSTVQSAVATGQQYLASAQEAAKPYVASAIATAKPYVDSAAATAKPYVDQASAAAQPHIEKAKSVLPGVSSTEPAATKPPAPSATTAPLESGPHVVGGPYPATTTGQSTKVAEL
ncbi:uncharacterized protein TRAVEDRAFT_55262 [Trametes versicolor FP-101664 SS1]|uniref:uncharacterized protein n=1 Tax=Trametes versicolor (strain FP-101664) TaxID=717944 RepID=UPI0004624805|nr:uncharacterized protein TRAVEDRAFT_55262 [Trametes versicolor FP-101664 SS1]EIW64300.1 hypothetical protein TRAVEDRAFT_55262 [Trametes versicolor FP-101664 SS1]